MISEKIVVIDDDPRVVKSINLAFPEYEIIDFINGEKALEYLRKPNTINLVLLDVMMPGIDGLTVLSEIKQHTKNISVIMMTAFGTREIIIQALRNHADDFIEKPFAINELKEKIKIILNEKMYQQNGRQDKDDQISRMKRFIERNYKDVSLKFIAAELCLSPRYVSRLFNKKNQINYRDYKLKIRIERAEELLVQTRLTVSEIGIHLGYQNPETFMRTFKRFTKLTPSQYRQKYGKRSKKEDKNV